LLRGNASEIMALAGQSGGTKGVDSTAASGAAIEAAKSLAFEFGCAVSVSGETDLVTDGRTLCFINGGSALMPRVTGMGCSASALVGAFAGVCGEKGSMLPLVAAMSVMAAAGTEAARTAGGPGTFLPLFLDNLHAMDFAMLERGVAIHHA
ncbi:hydroxyethylthiazole kinase, partial [Desulfovibrio sp. OttesenSCG-928-O18]|nr:hydroxyethylthiazole kinase [Desulfovibrio sp. OttesenSCG-928-O18]